MHSLTKSTQKPVANTKPHTSTWNQDIFESPQGWRTADGGVLWGFRSTFVGLLQPQCQGAEGTGSKPCKMKLGCWWKRPGAFKREIYCVWFFLGTSELTVCTYYANKYGTTKANDLLGFLSWVSFAKLLSFGQSFWWKPRAKHFARK